MATGWINPKIIIGNTATGENYFHRPNIFKDILEEIIKGNHVLLAAPRRVGKSSIMIYLAENCPDNAVCVFLDIQGIKSAREFYKIFYQQILKCLSKIDRGRAWINKTRKDLKVESIGKDGVKLAQTEINFLEEIYSVLPKLKKNDFKLILCFDELPEVLHNLYKADRKEEASAILDHLRTWRLDQALKNHFCLVLAGSIGIHHVVKNIDGRISDINDLSVVRFEPLSEDEAIHYIDWATGKATVHYSPELKKHLLSKIQYYLPYFINLMLDAINRQAIKDKNPKITIKQIDKAFDKIVRENQNFVEWKYRLFDYFPKTDALFQNELLTYLAHHRTIHVRQVYNLAVKHEKHLNYMSFVRGLERDGYIVKDGGLYVFVSPFLASFWKIDNPVYDEK